MDKRKLTDAAAALQRASDAIYYATRYPHSVVLPDNTQMAAAKAEVDCAKELIKEAESAR